MNGIRIFIDGACQPNPGAMGIGVVVEWAMSGPTVISEYGGEGTNNVAEYKALNRALQCINENQIMVAKIKCDSNLVVQQMKKIIPNLTRDPKIIGWKCNDYDLLELRNIAKNRIDDLVKRGFEIFLDYIPRELNLADAPAKAGCGKKNV